MNRLSERSALVTGGAVGIGRACVRRMARQSARVAVFDTPEVDGMSVPDDFARAVVWLAPDAAKFVTGTQIAIDGG